MGDGMKAPKISHWIQVLRGGNYIFDKEATDAINKVFEQLHKIAPCGDDERRELWLKAERGVARDYDDFEYLRDEEIVETYEDFTKMWLEEYSDEVNWFHLVTLEREDYRALFLGRELIYQSRVFEERGGYEYGAKELFVWIEETVKKAVEELADGTYNEDVNTNLSARQRTGTISRKDYWELFPDRKDSYLKDMSDEEIELFMSNIKEQTDRQPVGEYISKMTASRFYEYCSIGYKANKYENLEGLSAKEQYYKYADGRDEGLSKIDPDSDTEFEVWYNDRQRGGEAGIAVNPDTGVSGITELLNLCDYVMIMTVNPGFSGQKFIEFTKKKLEELAGLKAEYGFRLMIDGACSPEIIKETGALGVEGFVLGTSALFGKEQTYAEIIIT